MPADERSFVEPLPPQLYVDTDIWIAQLLEPEPHHARCSAFLQRIAHGGSTTLYVSSLTWIEFENVILKPQFRARLPREWHQRFGLARWQDATIRRAYIEFMLGIFDDALASFTWNEIPLTPDIRRRAARDIADHNVRPHDAVHLASATAVGVADFASLDEAFRRVDRLLLWNDHIHSGKPIRG